MNKKSPKRITSSKREFIKKSGLALGAAIIGSCSSQEEKDVPLINVNSNKKYKWKMVTTWPPGFPVVGEGCERLVEWIHQMSGGRLTINVYGAGELAPALETFEAVSSGAAEMGNGVSYYWAGKAPAASFFASIPFGMNAQQMHSWILFGGGYELWRELYAPFNVIPILSGNTGVQMGGWFNKEIKSMEDFKGLKMRMPGLGGKVLAKAGGTAVLSAGSEIYTNLERGVIDATEWIGPYHDYLMGFHQISKFYYGPGWHEPGSILETIVNKREFEKLPKDLQMIITAASERLTLWCLSEFEAKNNIYLEKIFAESDVKMKSFPSDVMAQLEVYSKEVYQELSDSDPMSKKVYESFSTFSKSIKQWSSHSEKLFHDLM